MKHEASQTDFQRLKTENKTMQMKKYKPGEIAEINSSNSPKIQRKGYANFERAELIASHPDLKNPDDQNIISIKRFASATELSNRSKSEVLITVKESIANGHHIYSIELFKINKASEKFRGLSDAAKNGEQGN